jgi:hypothetical protein
MKLTFAVAINAALAFASGAYAYPNANSQLSIVTPYVDASLRNVVLESNTTISLQSPPCEPFLISWSGGTPSYFLEVLDGKDTTKPPLEYLQANTQTTSFTWLPAYKSGKKLAFQLRDSTGARRVSGVFSVLKGGSTGCIKV